MKETVAMGVLPADHPGTLRLGAENYQNMNFGLCRILLAVINGDIDKHSLISDEAWDLVTILAYFAYVTNKVFAPAGVSGATLHRPPNCALGYTFPPVDSGWDSGDLETMAGGAGWHMSAGEVLRVMRTFRSTGTILPRAKAKEVLDSMFGIDDIHHTTAGTLYVKHGLYHSGGYTEQSVAYFLPESMELVVLANSPVGLPSVELGDTVLGVYKSKLK
jgi:hypothetical protein